MAEWRGRIKLKHHLSDKDDEASLRAVAANIAGVLERRIKTRPDDDLADIADEFRGCANPDLGPVHCDDINMILEALYDWADSNRIWIE